MNNITSLLRASDVTCRNNKSASNPVLELKLRKFILYSLLDQNMLMALRQVPAENCE